ncbi:inositol monophosphatase 1-like protein [Globomyces pollinis-pini]|nr:inositol monophosphatase 1-like protein [Globomyces pollinis-pini]
MTFQYDDDKLQLWLSTAIQAGITAGKKIKEAITQQKQIETKENNADLVTKTDQEVESFLFNLFETKFPDHLLIGEETSAKTGSIVGTLQDKPTWIIDPVDGTTNFVHGFPFCCVSIGLAVNKVPVYNPVLDQLFYAAKGQGSFLCVNPTESTKIGDGVRLNGSPVALPTKLGQALILTEYGASKDPEYLEPKIEIIKRIMTNPIAGRGIRSLGTAALSMCTIAQGCGDIYYEAGPHAWDVCAGAIIVEEAGGITKNICLDTGSFDVLERTVLCVRGTVGQPKQSTCPLIVELEKLIIPMNYPRD